MKLAAISPMGIPSWARRMVTPRPRSIRYLLEPASTRIDWLNRVALGAGLPVPSRVMTSGLACAMSGAAESASTARAANAILRAAARNRLGRSVGIAVPSWWNSTWFSLLWAPRLYVLYTAPAARPVRFQARALPASISRKNFQLNGSHVSYRYRGPWVAYSSAT